MSKSSAPQGEKLQKVLAREGLASRREAERWISEGRIKINQRIATLGDRVSEDDTLYLDDRKLYLKAVSEFERKVIAYHKKEGEICSRQDPEGRPTVFANLPYLKHGRWISIGRLDFNTTGLLLLTNDGELANKLMHPSSQIDREYLVRVMGEVDEEMIKRLKEGVALDDGTANFTDVVEDKRSDEGSINKWFCVCVMEGKNREVRRLWESQGVTVSRLKRVRFGPIFLPSRLKRGRYEYLTEKDVKTLVEAAGL